MAQTTQQQGFQESVRLGYGRIGTSEKHNLVLTMPLGTLRKCLATHEAYLKSPQYAKDVADQKAKDPSFQEREPAMIAWADMYSVRGLINGDTTNSFDLKWVDPTLKRKEKEPNAGK